METIILLKIGARCCVFWLANACLRMRSHGTKRWKTLENDEKSNISNEQPAFGCQPAFGSHSQSLTNKLFLRFSAWAIREPLMIKKGMFLTIFECFSLFSTMQMYTLACVGWLKYTTITRAELNRAQIAKDVEIFAPIWC